MVKLIRLFIVLLVFVCGLISFDAEAANIVQYSNTLSDSGPNQASNHTLRFTSKVAINSGAYLDVQFPPGFVVENATTTFGERNVELYVNGVPRVASGTIGFGVDLVTINSGNGGSVRYTLGTGSGIPADSNLELRIGNHSSVSLDERQVYTASSGTTTLPADVEPIRNSGALGLHHVGLDIVDGGVIADANFLIFLNRKISVKGDTTEEIPPFRFNGAPSSTIAGTSLFVEISLETDEFAVCRYSTASGTPYFLMTNEFSNTGLVVHTTNVPVVPNTFLQFFVRCIDDENNYNVDDFAIEFSISAEPTGTSNTTGSTSGDGTGSGDDGTGTGQGDGGTTGGSDGDTNESGNDTGGGGSGGGSGGGGGGGSGGGSGGGFESTDGPYESGDGRVIINGLAFPDADVTILIDGQIADQVQAARDGKFSITIDEIARGAYTFGIYAEDENSNKSSTFSTSFTVSGARASRLSNINITPVITVSPDPAEPGETVTFSGYAMPDATVTLETGRTGGANSVNLTAVSDSDGFYSTTLTTQGFARDTYQVRAMSEQEGGDRTGFSDYVFYGIGQEAENQIFADLNRDGSVNLVDFSILLFWWQTSGGDSDPPADINADGTVSLTDFSILLFNWTG